MNAEFNWWLLIVGLVLGAALTWLVMSETTRRDIDVTEREQRSEAAWIAAVLSRSGRPLSPDRVDDVLRLHRDYLAAPPPDDPDEATPPADGAEIPEPGSAARAPGGTETVTGTATPTVTLPAGRQPADPTRPPFAGPGDAPLD